MVKNGTMNPQIGIWVIKKTKNNRRMLCQWEQVLMVQKKVDHQKKIKK